MPNISVLKGKKQLKSGLRIIVSLFNDREDNSSPPPYTKKHWVSTKLII